MTRRRTTMRRDFADWILGRHFQLITGEKVVVGAVEAGRVKLYLVDTDTNGTWISMRLFQTALQEGAVEEAA